MGAAFILKISVLSEKLFWIILLREIDIFVFMVSTFRKLKSSDSDFGNFPHLLQVPSELLMNFLIMCSLPQNLFIKSALGPSSSVSSFSICCSKSLMNKVMSCWDPLQISSFWDSHPTRSLSVAAEIENWPADLKIQDTSLQILKLVGWSRFIL